MCEKERECEREGAETQAEREHLFLAFWLSVQEDGERESREEKYKSNINNTFLKSSLSLEYLRL